MGSRDNYKYDDDRSSRRRNMSPNGRGRSRSIDERDYKSSYSRRDDDRDDKRRYSRSASRSRRRYSRSRSRSYNRSRSRTPYTYRRRYGTREQPKECRCVGVFGLNSKTTENQLHHIFSKYGSIDKITIIYDKKTGRSRGFGFVYFFNNEDARAAKNACNDMEIDDAIIRVDFSITARAHTPTPGAYMGRPIGKYDSRRRDDDDRYDSRRRVDDRYDTRRRDDDNGYERSRGSYRDRHSPSPRYRDRRDRSRSRSYSRRY